MKKFTHSGFGWPDGPFVDDKGYVYVPDVDKVFILSTSSGKVIKEFKSSIAKGLTDAVVSPDGTLWIVDWSGHAVYLY